ncbi:MAG TPA: polysaccharide biosynthesis protein, partial [Rikenellaceae bacterium]|nr:polysaccharide biosynthesis protein [Rikenellaceae bacterium]
MFVSGAAGSIGSEFCRQVAGLNVVKQLILMDMAETPMHYLRLELEEKYPNLDFVPIIGDVRNKASINDLLA